MGIDPLKKAKHYSAAKKKIQVNHLAVMSVFKENTESMKWMYQNISKYRVKVSGKTWYCSLINYIISVTLADNGNCTDCVNETWIDLALLEMLHVSICDTIWSH